MFWCVSYHLGAFGTVRMPYETQGKTGRTCKSLCHEVASEFFATNPLDPLHWSLNSCFGLFRTVWVFLRPFRAKRSELVQKFVPRTRVGISATKAPNPPHGTLNSCFGAFRTIWIHLGPLGCLMKLWAKQAELVQMFVPRSRIEVYHNKHTRSTPLDPKLLIW